MKSLFKSKLVIMPIAAAAAALAVAAPAAATSLGWGAQQEGTRQGGSADSAVIKIRVEAALPPDAALLPDDPGCPPPGSSFAPAFCSGTPLNLTIENKSANVLRITAVAQTLAPTCASPPCGPMAIASDRNDDGGWNVDVIDYVPFFSPSATKNCGTYATFVAPTIVTYSIGGLGAKQLPVIPPHSTLQVPAGGGQSAGTIRLAYNTPANCQGASFRVPLTVTATPVTS